MNTPPALKTRPIGFSVVAALGGFNASVTRFAWSPDGLWLAVPSRDGTVRLFDFRTGFRHSCDGQVIFRLDQTREWSPKQVMSVCWGGSSDLLFALYDSGLSELRLRDGECVSSQSLTPSVGGASAAVWASRTQTLVTAFSDKISVWDSETHEIAESHPGSLGNVGLVDIAVSPDGHTVAVPGATGIHFFDVLSSRWSEQLPQGDIGSSRASFAPNRGVAVIRAQQGVCIWSPDGSGSYADARKLEGTFNTPTCLTFSTDGSLLALKYHDGIAFWRTETWERLPALDEVDLSGDGLHSIAFNPRFPILASLAPDGLTVRLREVDVDKFVNAYSQPPSSFLRDVDDATRKLQSKSANPETSTLIGLKETSEQTFSFDALISYSSRDKEWVRTLVQRLEKDGCRIWFDEKNIDWGQRIRHAIREGISKSRHLIVVLSPNAVGSDWVELETLIATWEDPANRRLTLLPLLYRECVIPEDMRHLKHLDVTTQFKLDHNYPQILKTLSSKNIHPQVQGYARDHALIIDLCTTSRGGIPPSETSDGEKLYFKEVVRVPQLYSADLAQRLRSVPIDGDAWRSILEEVDRAIKKVISGCEGRIHVFIQAPHAVAFLVGRRLDDFGRGVGVVTHQQGRDNGGWTPFFTTPQRMSGATVPSFFSEDWKMGGEERGRGWGSLLSVEVPHHPSQEVLNAAQTEVGAARLYRIAPTGLRAWIESTAEAGVALSQLEDALVGLNALHPGEPIHLLTSAPVALMVELGRKCSPHVFPSIVVHQYDAHASRYHPVLDCMVPTVVESDLGARDQSSAIDPLYDWDFFIAHASATEDTRAAEILYDALDPHCQVFMDTRRLLPGDAWDDALPKAQRRARMSVILISRNTKKSWYKRDEIATAVALARDDLTKHRVVPVYLDGQPQESEGIPYGLRRLVSLDVRNDGGLDGVGASLRRLLQETATSNPTRRFEKPDHDQVLEQSVSDRTPTEGTSTTRGARGQLEDLQTLLTSNPTSPAILIPLASHPAIRTCDRFEQWGQIQRLASERMHRLIFIPGAAGQGHGYFSMRIERDLVTNPATTIRRLYWERRSPDSSSDYFADLAQKLHCTSDALPETLRDLLHERPILIVHKTLESHYGDAVWQSLFFTGIPEMVRAVGPTRHGLQWVQPVSWDHCHWTVRWLHSMTSHANVIRRFLHPLCHEGEARRLMQSVSRSGTQSGLRVSVMSDITQITDEHVHAYLIEQGYSDDEVRTMIPDLLMGGPDSEQIIKRLVDGKGMSAPRVKQLLED